MPSHTGGDGAASPDCAGCCWCWPPPAASPAARWVRDVTALVVNP
ncbi:hypothetical protein [Pseudonocardia sp. GCM10023141]